MRSAMSDRTRSARGHRRPGQVIARVLMLVAGLRAGACSEQPDSGDAGTTTVVLKHSNLFGEPGAFERLLAQFEHTLPGVRVRAETLPAASNEQHQFYVINLAVGSAGFDVLALDVIWVAEFARAGWMRDISHLLPGNQRREFFPGPIEAVAWEGHVYALPWFMDAGIL